MVITLNSNDVQNGAQFVGSRHWYSIQFNSIKVNPSISTKEPDGDSPYMHTTIIRQSYYKQRSPLISCIRYIGKLTSKVWLHIENTSTKINRRLVHASTHRIHPIVQSMSV